MISYGLNNIVPYLGGWGTTFLATVLFIIIFRIWVAFVFKLLRMNIDYHNTATSTKTLYQHSKK